MPPIGEYRFGRSELYWNQSSDTELIKGLDSVVCPQPEPKGNVSEDCLKVDVMVPKTVWDKRNDHRGFKRKAELLLRV
jgi:carboxylesterase type B